MEYELKQITASDVQALVDDGTFSSLYQSSLPALSHDTKPTYDVNHLTGSQIYNYQLYNEILGIAINLENKSTYHALVIIEKPKNSPEKIVGLRIGNLREEKPWIDEEEDQSNYFWAHIELLRKNTAGSKSWYYDPDWLKIEAVHFKNLGVNKWHCLMKPGTTYIDAVNVQAEIRSSDDLFKTPVWSDVTFNSVVWKKLEFNI